MRRWMQLIVFSAPIALAACEVRESAAVPEPSVPIEGERRPVPETTPTPTPTPTPTETTPTAPTEPAEAEPSTAFSQAESRYNDLQSRVAQLRDAIDQLGESVTQDLREDCEAMVKLQDAAQLRFEELRSATASTSASLGQGFTTAADELEAAIKALAAKLPT